MNSKNGFQTNVWGPMAWTLFHMITLNYDPKRQKEYYTFFKSLKGVLPCGACRKNFSDVINGKNQKTKLSLDKFKSRHSLSYWFFVVHNEVQNGIYSRSNNINDKPVYSNSKTDFYKAMKKYEPMRAKCYKNSYGCTVPNTGTRKRAEIHILPRSKCPQKRKDPIKIHKKCRI